MNSSLSDLNRRPAAYEHDKKPRGVVSGPLSPREAEMAALSKNGMPYSQIAAHLGVSKGCVSNTMQRVYEKCGVSSHAEYIRLMR